MMPGVVVLCVVTVVGIGLRELPAAMAESNAASNRTSELDGLARLRESQRAATADLIARLVEGSMSLTEVVDMLEKNAQGQPVFLNQLAVGRDETTDRERLAGYALDRAKVWLSDAQASVSTGTMQGSR